MTRVDLDVVHLLETAAHDLRGPLSVLAGYTAMLEEQIGHALSDDQRDMMAALQRSTRRLMRTGDVLSALANLEQGASPLTRVETPWAAWVAGVAATLDPPLTVAPEEGADAQIALDPVLMRVALEALRDDLDGAPDEPPVAVISTSTRPGHVQLRIGPRGLVEAAGQAATAPGPSSGRRATLGRLLAARIVEAHGGRLEGAADAVLVIDLPSVAG